MSGSGGAYTRSDQFGRIIRSFRAAAGPTLMIGGAGSLMPMAAGSAAAAILSTRRRDAAGRAVRLRGMQIEPPCIQLEVLRLLRADAATR